MRSPGRATTTIPHSWQTRALSVRGVRQVVFVQHHMSCYLISINAKRTDMATLEELEANLQSMQEQLRLLEVRLDHERSLRRRLMRDTHQCPACGQEKIFFVNQLEVYAGGSTG